MKRLILFFLLLSPALLAQDTLSISEVLISERTDHLNTSHHITSFDTAALRIYAQNPIADLLRDQSSVFIKSYGNGALSTVSMRGTSSVHTALIWNGVPVNLSSTGDIDLSNSTVNSFDKITILHGANSSFYGSGAIGGSILLANNPSFGEGTSGGFSLKAGSFGNYAGNAVLKHSSAKFSAKVSLNALEHKNEFRYRSSFLNEQRIMKQAEHSGKGISSSLFYRMKRSILAFHSWTEIHDRNIPAGLSSISPYSAQQWDRNSRNLLELRTFREKYQLNLKTAYIYDRLSYMDTITSVDSEGKQNTAFAEASVTADPWKNTRFTAGMNGSAIRARNNYYTGNAYRKQVAGFAGINHRLEQVRSNAIINIREDLIDNVAHAFTYNAAFSKDLGKNWKSSVSSGKSFRAPSLNDLYWVPGGNPDLIPERGFNNEVSLKYLKEKLNDLSEASFTFYSGKTDNWIIWLPATATIWTPQNLKKVWSRGIEFSGGKKIRLNRTIISVKGSYAYTEATSESAKTDDVILKEQIIYVPYYNASGTISLDHRSVSFYFNQTFTGGRYTAADHSAALPWFSLGNARVTYTTHLKKIKAALFIASTNIWDTSFEVVVNRPMPGRSIETGLSIHFN